MSASSKKKLRKEQNAAALTEKQRAEQKEAKKLKAYTLSFVAIMLAVVIVAVSVITATGINRSGIFQKNTIAAIVNGQEINTVEMTYYLKDAISSTYSEWYNYYGDYTNTYVSWLLNLDVTKPLDKQAYTEGGTWADHFMEIALQNAKSNYTLYNIAKEKGFEMPEADKETLEENLSTMSFYAAYYGYKNLDAYLQSLYGFGSTTESYKAYFERISYAQSYYDYIYDSLTYDEEAIRAYEKGKYDNYTSYSYAVYEVNYNSYLTGGTKDDKGNMTYTDEEIAAAKKQAYDEAKFLSAASDLEELDLMIAGLKVNEEKKNVSATEMQALSPEISSVYRNWLTSTSRQKHDVTFISNQTTSKDKDGNETTSVNGYYVVMFLERNENNRPLGNVRHLLVKFAGGTKDDNGNITYSEVEKNTAKEKAEGYLNTWKKGEATEASFIELVKKHSDDSSAKDGGLFEDITPDSEYVTNFLNWAIDESRHAGDCEVIETEYGYHVMYYVGDSELSYRDYLITDDLRTEDLEEWYNDIMKSSTGSFKDLSRMNLSLKISG